MMAVEAARRLRDGLVCFVGIGLPSLAANLARHTHAPRTRADLRERDDRREARRAAALDRRRRAGRDRGHRRLRPGAVRVLAPGRRIDVCFLGAAQIDRHGNLNSTVIGDYDSPTVRLPGGGGAPESALGAREVFVMLRHSPRAFVEQLDFATSLGDNVRDGDHRPRRAGAARRRADPRRPPPGRAGRGRHRGDRLGAPGRGRRARDGAAERRRARRRCEDCARRGATDGH